MTILFSHATVLCMDEAGTVLQDGYVLVRGREIAYVGPIRPQERADREVNATGKVLMPGFVDAHTHLTMSLMRGYGGGHDLQTWLNDYIFPVEAKLDSRAVRAGTALSLAEAIAGGVTEPALFGILMRFRRTMLGMFIGGAIGAFNGFFVAKFKLHPFIVTLGTQLILYSCLLLYVKMGNNGGMAISGLDKSYNDFIKGSIISVPTGNGTSTPIPNYVWFAILLAAVMWFIWNKTTFGKNMFALGSNEEAARVSGVNVLMTTVLVFALAGAMYGWTGFVEGARVGSNTANTGLNYELDGIAACVIGGVSFVGGIGKIRGIVIGVLLLRLIFVGLNMASVNQDLIYLVKGGIILFACALDMRKYLVKK